MVIVKGQDSEDTFVEPGEHHVNFYKIPWKQQMSYGLDTLKDRQKNGHGAFYTLPPLKLSLLGYKYTVY